MKSYVFLLALALVGSVYTSRYDPSFSENSLHIYRYEGVILSGLPERGLTQAGVRINSKVKIRGIGQRQYLLQIEDPRIQELNGIWPKDPFTSARKLTARLAPHLTKPVKFEYNGGRVGSIYTPPTLPEDVLNIHRGIINIFQITIKKSQNFYDLQEAGIEGVCHTRYVLQEDKRKERLTITKSKDLTNCQERIVKNTGMAYTELCPGCQQRGRNIRASATLTQILKPTASGAILQEARVREVHQFTPFHELDGALRVEARQSLKLEQITTASVRTVPDLQNRNSLQYRSDSSVLQQPFTLVWDQNAVSKIKETLEHIAKHNVQGIHTDAPTKFLQLIQLLRSVQHSTLSDIWRTIHSNTELRRWFIEALPAVGTSDSLKFLKTRIQASDLTQLEILQTLILAMHQVKTDRQVMIVALEIISLTVIKENIFLRKATLLAYGSMVNRYCSQRTTCPDDMLKPLHNLLTEASSRHDDESIALSLKAIGNAGQPESIKSIVKLLPGFGTAAGTLPLKIRVDAIMALTLIAKKDPKTVQRITVQTFLNRKNHPEERMVACAVLFLTKPPLTLVTVVASSLLTETSLQVASFTQSHMSALSRSSLPGLYPLATSCTLALNLLSPRLEQLGHRFSKVYRMDTFMYQLMTGLSAKALLIKSSSTIIPTALMAKVKGHALGGASDLLEVGLRAEGLQKVITKARSSGIRITENKAIRRILSKIVNWKDLPEEEPLASAYVKLLGQELGFSQFRKDDVEQIGKFLTDPLSKQWTKYIDQLNKGISFQTAKAILTSEIRRVVPTGVGFPLELSLVTASLVVAKGSIEVRSDSPISKPSHLISSRIQVKARLLISAYVYGKAYLGINMPSLQSGVKIEGNIRTTIPVEITAKICVKEGNLRIDSTPAQKETKILSMDSQVFAVSRNIENLSVEKITPILPATSRKDISSQRFRTSSQSSDVPDDRTVAQVSPETLSDQIPCSGEDPRPWLPSRSSYRTCVNAPKFGVQACLDALMENALSIRHIPLYRIIGRHQFNITTLPITSGADVEKIVLEIQTGAKSVSKMIRLEDKETKMERTPSGMDQDQLRKILLKTTGQSMKYNTTLSKGLRSSSSSSSSSRLSGSSSITRSSLRSTLRRASGEPRASRRTPSTATISSSSSSSSSSSMVRRSSQRRSRTVMSSQRARTRHSSQRLLRSSTRSGRSQRSSRQLLELRFIPEQTSQVTITRHSGGITASTSIRQSTSDMITRIGRTSGLKQSSSSSLLRSSKQRLLIGSIGTPSLVVLLRARKTDGVQQGYQLTGYGKISSRLPRMHLRLVELDQKSNWKICADALVPSSHRVLTMGRWGDNCEKYKVSAKLSSGQLGSQPALRVKMRWSKINDNLKYGGKVLGDYVPGLAYALGLSQSYRRNPSRQITALVALTSPQTIDTILRLPKMTVYYQGLKLPTTLPVHAVSRRIQAKGFSSITEIPELFFKMNERECTAESDTLRMFDGEELTHRITNDCLYVLTQDCTESPKFMLLMRRAESDKTKKSIRLILSIRNTTIDAVYLPGTIKMLVNGHEHSLDQQIPNLQDIVTVQWNGTGITLRVPSVNIERLYFDGDKVQIAVDQMMGKTCGLCGLNNGERKLTMPGWEEAKDVEQLFESWLCSGTSCKDDCRVKQEFVELGKVVNFEGQASKCYSTETVQRCLAQCTPTETRSRLVNFHCVPSNFTVTDISVFSKKSKDLSRTMDSHTDCLCKCTD